VAVLLFIIPSINIYPVTGTSEDAVRELERRRYETEKRLREKERLEIERYKEDKEKKKEITEPVGDGTGFFISKIIIENSEQLSDREKDNLIGPYLNRVIAINDITLLVGSITNRLVEKGYITSRVKVPVDQQLKSGVLVLTVVKGYIANIKPEEDSLSTRMQVFTAFPLLEGKYLNIEDLDYGVEQMNRLRSNNATMKILPGEELGFSDIIIYNEQGERLTLDIGVDNLGQKNTGEKRGKISAGFENPFNINDSISADYTTSLNTDIDRKYNRSWSFNYSFPLGYWSFSSTYSRSEYMQYVYGLSRDFRSSGIDTSIVFGADRMLGRIKDNRFKGRASLTLKDKKNFIEDAIVESSSRKLTIVRFGLDYNTFIYGGYFSANAFYNRGLELFGAYKDDGDMEIETPRAQFEKYDMSLMWNRSFMLFGQSFGYLFNLTGQWGMETLYSSEKISIGDMNTVRGFKGSSISGDRGFYIRNDFSVFDFSRLWNPLKGVKYFVAYDYGYAVERTGRDANFGAGEGSVMGWATGISYSSGVADMSVTYARQLFSPWFVKEENYVVYFAATLKLTGLFNEARVAFR
jgi:hemolysin activation/secretion protein